MPIPSIYTEWMLREYAAQGYWGPDLISHFCDRNAVTYPNKEAVVDSRRRYTWKQAKATTDKLALALRHLGFKKDDVLTVQLPNCAEHFLILMACEKAGVVVGRVPVTFRQAELQAVMRHTEARGVLIPYEHRGHNHFDLIKEVQPSLPQLKHIIIWGEMVPPGAISLEEILGKAAIDKGATPLTPLGPLDVGQINATSGTTGIPKCCEMTGAARVWGGKVLARRVKLTPDDIFACLAPFTAGGTSTLANHAAPLVGAKVVMLEGFTPAEACQLMEQERVTGAGVVPALLNRLVNYPDLKKHDLSSLRFVLSATALLPYSLAQETEEKLGCKVINWYGALDYGSVSGTSLDDTPEARYGTVGRPIEGTEVRFLDEAGREVSPGEVGEVWVRGPSCVGGYFRNPALNQQTHRDGFFDMGEQGRMDGAGSLTLMGRKRDVIMRGGQNIFPKEVEELLLRHPQVLDVAIVRMPDPELGERACAYVVPRPGCNFTFEEMVSFLREHKIAAFKLPERLELLPELPLVPGGQKIDRRALEEAVAQKLAQERQGDKAP